MSNKLTKPTTTAFRNIYKGTDAYTRHKHLIKNYLLYYGEKPKPHVPDNYKTERDIIQENHKFVRTDADLDTSSWEQRVAKKYYDKLFKEYAICELKYYKEGKIALRWRTEKEVMSGKGQFICASTRCESRQDLMSWEVNFGYIEDGEKKNELVKVRLCMDCSDNLNYKTKKRLAQNIKRKRKEEEKETGKHTKKKSKRDDDSVAESNFDHSSDDEDQEEEKEQEKAESSVWSKPLQMNEEKSKEEEYEDYFADLLQ